MTLAKQNNERIVKQYHCTRWAQPKLDGYITITTERVIFAGASKVAANGKPTDRIVEEAELKTISGLSCFYGTKINWLWLVLGIAGILGGILGFFSSCFSLTKAGRMPVEMIALTVLGVLFALAFIILGILMIVKLAFGKAFFLNIYSSQTAGTPISLGNTDRANHVLLSLAGLPTEETDDMMEELGALITDLKTDREEAYKTWAVQ
jgi:hypothetical protein